MNNDNLLIIFMFVRFIIPTILWSWVDNGKVFVRSVGRLSSTHTLRQLKVDCYKYDD